VARQLDAYGDPVEAARHTYIRHATGGTYPPVDMRRGERLLVEAGLIREENGMLYPSPELTTLAAVEEEVAHETLLTHCLAAAPPDWLLQEPVTVPSQAEQILQDLLPDPERREAFLLVLGRRFDAQLLAELGTLGEEHVVAAARAELEALGRDDLAAGVRRVSLLSDQLGYDVVAPRPDGRTRRLEVKTAGRRDSLLARFYLSRNEADVGLSDPDWALIYCRRDGNGDVDVVGWCRARNLLPYLPADAPGGRWRVVEITMPGTALFDDIPPAV
jgi:hypothetical protein